MDAFIHVDPFNGRERGLAMVFNPTRHALTSTMEFPLYYAGMLPFEEVDYTINDGEDVNTVRLNFRMRASLIVTVEAQSVIFLTFYKRES